MSAKGVKALEAELGGTAPDGLSALTDTQLRSFGDALHESKARQSEALERAIDQALEFGWCAARRARPSSDSSR